MMNIEVSEIKKQAGVIGKTLRYVYRHPWQVILPTAAVGAGLSIASKVHPAHQMFREETKRTAIKEQNNTLKEILSEVKKSNEEPAAQPSQKILIQPLA